MYYRTTNVCMCAYHIDNLWCVPISVAMFLALYAPTVRVYCFKIQPSMSSRLHNDDYPGALPASTSSNAAPLPSPKWLVRHHDPSPLQEAAEADLGTPERTAAAEAGLRRQQLRSLQARSEKEDGRRRGNGRKATPGRWLQGREEVARGRRRRRQEAEGS